MNQDNLIFAFTLTTLAGLSTAIGAGIAFFAKKTDTKLLSTAMGFSAGVMIYISFVELLSEGFSTVNHVLGETLGGWVVCGCFFGGMIFTALIDKMIPSFENPHEFHDGPEPPDDELKYKKLYRMGIFTALAIGIHNFPEGIVTFIGSMKDPSLGISIAIAVAIHNIPEGIAVSTPIFYATGNKKKAFFYSVLSGLAEPAGALVGYLLLRNFLSDVLMGTVFAFIAGVMIFISFDQLLPAAQKFGSHHRSIYGLVAGMAVMAISILIGG